MNHQARTARPKCRSVRIQQVALIGGLLCLSGGAALAQSLSVSVGPAAMKVTTAVPGQQPTPVTSGVTTYTVESRNKNTEVKISARLNTAMPAGVTLTLNMVAPLGGTSNGPVPLDATDREMIINFAHQNPQTANMTYQLSATAAAGVVTSQSRTVTFTLAAWP